jgi:isoleucyl-tRNA synthetase
VLDKQGADAVRWYFFTAGAPWLPNRFSDRAVAEGQRKFMATLWNTYAFFVLYAEIDRFDPKEHDPAQVKYTLMDRWILSRLNQLVKQVDDDLSNYRIPEPANAVTAFVDDLSNWYVRRGRERFWGKGMDDTKEAAFVTLYTVLTTLSKVIAPFVPFMSEDIYQNLVRGVYADAPESVHLCDFPTADESLIDEPLNTQMEALLRVVSLGRACRNAAGLKVRQPLTALYVKGAALEDAFVELAADELNVKSVIFTNDARAFTTYNLKPQMRTLGPKYGKLLGRIGAWLKEADGNDVMDTFARGENVVFTLDETPVELAADDVLSESVHKPGFASQEDNGLTVVLDCNLTPELIAEGYQREVVSKLQTMRKDAGFAVTDRIEVAYRADAEVAAAVETGKAFIMQSVLAVALDAREPEADAVTQEWDVNGRTAVLSVRKA